MKGPSRRIESGDSVAQVPLLFLGGNMGGLSSVIVWIDPFDGSYPVKFLVCR